jgi:hypothetical protein
MIKHGFKGALKSDKLIGAVANMREQEALISSKPGWNLLGNMEFTSKLSMKNCNSEIFLKAALKGC